MNRVAIGSFLVAAELCSWGSRAVGGNRGAIRVMTQFLTQFLTACGLCAGGERVGDRGDSEEVTKEEAEGGRR
jgi:hypothetical protein